MSSHAQVRSTDAIDAFQAALAKFAQRVQNALDSLDGELHRANDWIDHDRPAHWRVQTHKAEEGVSQAKVELERCLMFTLAGERPQCREQKAALMQAQARLAYCQEKGEAVKRWQREFRHESFEYDGRVGQLRRALEQELPRARALLARILRRLDEYQVERPPESQPAAPTVAPASPPASAARPERDDAPCVPLPETPAPEQEP